MLTAIWNMLTNGTFHEDLGRDLHARPNPDKTKQRPDVARMLSDLVA